MEEDQTDCDFEAVLDALNDFAQEITPAYTRWDSVEDYLASLQSN